jgi:hypothetical protein
MHNYEKNRAGDSTPTTNQQTHANRSSGNPQFSMDGNKYKIDNKDVGIHIANKLVSSTKSTFLCMPRNGGYENLSIDHKIEKLKFENNMLKTMISR